MHKEWSELKVALFTPLNLYAGYLSLAVVMVICSVYMPLQLGIGWIGSLTMVYCYIFFIPFCVVGITMSTAFTLERQHHTLEVLLASPASDAAILLGKVFINTLYGWGSSLVCIGMGLLTANISFVHAGVLLYPPDLTISLIVFSFMLSFFFSVMGALTSLHARTYLEAQRNLVFILFVPTFAVSFLLGPLAPLAWKSAFSAIVSLISYPNEGIFFGSILLFVNIALIAACLHRFNRKQLITE